MRRTRQPPEKSERLPARHSGASTAWRTRPQGCHAFFALLWVVVGYAQMVVFEPSRARHATFSRVAFLSFGCHIAAALGILWYDSPRSTALNKLKLLEVTVTSSACFARALQHAFAGRRRAHRQWMVTCFILSIEGAGTIRTVAHDLS